MIANLSSILSDIKSNEFINIDDFAVFAHNWDLFKRTFILYVGETKMVKTQKEHKYLKIKKKIFALKFTLLL